MPDDRATVVIAATSTGNHHDRLDFYQRAAQANEQQLLELIGQVAATPNSRARRFSAEILLSRYAEINPRSALKISRKFRSDKSLTASLYAVWSRTDRQVALDAMSGESDSAIARQAPILLVEELGGDSSALLDVLDALPPHIDQLGIQIAVLVAQSAFDPVGAISQAGDFTNPRDRDRALRRIGRDLASRDPQQAFSVGAQIVDDDSRLTYQGEVMGEWVAIDPGGVLDYLAASTMSYAEMRMMARYTFSAIADAEPERLMAVAGQWSGAFEEQARYVVLRQWSENDPQRAIDFVGGLPPGQKRDQLLSSIARGYGKADVDAALAWASTLQPRPNGIFGSVIERLAVENPDRAFDLALSLASGDAPSEALQGVIMRAAYSGADAERMANKVLTLQNEQLRRQALQMLSYSWARQDPSAVIAWLVTNNSRMPKESFQAAARQLAETDPYLAAEYMSQVPVEARADWLQQVAHGLAKNDPAAAMNWVSQYQGEPGYNAALATIAAQSAQNDPVAAARSIDRNPDASSAAVVARTADREWARRDPQSAAAWAARVGNEQVRRIAITNVARQWAYEDASGASQWVLTLPPGPTRDSALAAAVAGGAAQGVPDEELLRAFSSDMARQQAVVSAAYRLARIDRAAADRLIRKYVSDATLRSQVERNLASIIP
jgi:hypothetical protein